MTLMLCFAVLRALLWYEKYERWFPEPQAQAAGSLPKFSGKPCSARRGSADTFMRKLGVQISLFLDFCAHQPYLVLLSAVCCTVCTLSDCSKHL